MNYYPTNALQPCLLCKSRPIAVRVTMGFDTDSASWTFMCQPCLDEVLRRANGIHAVHVTWEPYPAQRQSA
jgi:hypothetical protein